MLSELFAKNRRFWKGDAERAFGEERHLVDQNLDDGAKRQRHHRQIRPGDAQRRQGQQRTKRRRHADAGRNDDPQRRAQLHEQHTSGVGTHTKQTGVAQRHLAGVADHDVQPVEQDGVDHDRADHVDVVRIAGQQRCRRQQGQPQDGGHKGLAVHLQTFLIAFLPNRPAGLKASTSSNSTSPGTSL